MRIVVQRVTYADCVVDQQITGKIDRGLMLLVGFTHQDDESLLPEAVKKVIHLRIFEDEFGKMNRSILDIQGSILSISQFTLYGDCKKGNRPSFVDSMEAQKAKYLYDCWLAQLRSTDVPVSQGIFGADMVLHPTCDGPVTIILEF